MMADGRMGGRAVGCCGARCIVLAALLLSASPPVRLSAQETSLTIYQDGSVLVRRVVAQALRSGANVVSLELGTTNADPSSFVVTDDGVELRTARVMLAQGPDAALRRSMGRDVDFWIQLRDTSYFVRGRLLSVQPFAVRVDGRVLYQMPGQPAFAESLVQFSPRAELTVNAGRAATALHAAYLTSGLSWRATLTAIVPRVGGGPATVSGTAVIENQGLTLRGAEVQLASGDIRRVGAARPMAMARRANALEEASVTSGMVRIAPMPTEEGVAETRLYSLPARLDFEPGVITSTALFAATTAEVERLLVIGASGVLAEQWVGRADSGLHPEVHYRLRRPETSGFGALPLPQGVVRLLAPDTAGRLQLLGEAQLGATPPGRDVELATGTASDVVADRTQTAFERRGDRDVVVAFRVAVHNGKDESVTVAVNEDARGRWEVLSSTVPLERVNASQFRFLVPVAARGEAVLEYRVRVRW